LRQLQAGARLLRQQFFHGLAYGAHGGIRLAAILKSCLNLSVRTHPSAKSRDWQR
jgi:hypothetical protein